MILLHGVAAVFILTLIKRYVKLYILECERSTFQTERTSRRQGNREPPPEVVGSIPTEVPPRSKDFFFASY